MTQEIKEWAMKLAQCAGQDGEQARAFVAELENSQEIQEELCYYYEHQNFLCKHRVAGYTIVDILVWQVDHFKAFLDRPDEMNRYRQDRLVWSAFHTMLKMQEHPENYQRKMQEETGTDYAGKY
ncbi:MAG: hypothetical protein K2L18_05920 [Acetatifactor sp.]|nr:hypothetical protein [Acetatifactor sp.]